MGHFYTKTGLAAHFQPDGRETTLREARKQFLAPGTTQVIGDVLAKHGLTAWLIDTAMNACLTLPQIEGESLDDFKARAKEDSKVQSEKAKADGTAIHKQVESWFKGETVQETPHVLAVLNALREHGFSTEGWVAEKRFCSPMGYGGAVDLSRPGVIADIKTKQDWKDTKSLAYPEMCMQGMAYAHGLNDPKARVINIFLSVKEPVQCYIHEWEELDKLRYWTVFTRLLEVWKLLKKYDPTEKWA